MVAERRNKAREPQRVWEGEAEAKVTERKAREEAGEGTMEASEEVSRGEVGRRGREGEEERERRSCSACS